MKREMHSQRVYKGPIACSTFILDYVPSRILIWYSLEGISLINKVGFFFSLEFDLKVQLINNVLEN